MCPEHQNIQEAPADLFVGVGITLWNTTLSSTLKIMNNRPFHLAAHGQPRGLLAQCRPRRHGCAHQCIPQPPIRRSLQAQVRGQLEQPVRREEPPVPEQAHLKKLEEQLEAAKGPNPRWTRKALPSSCPGVSEAPTYRNQGCANPFSHHTDLDRVSRSTRCWC